MKSLGYFKRRKLEVENLYAMTTQDLQGAEYDLKENPCKETWEAVESLERKLELLDSEMDGICWTIANYDQYCYFEEQEELMTAYAQMYE